MSDEEIKKWLEPYLDRVCKNRNGYLTDVELRLEVGVDGGKKLIFGAYSTETGRIQSKSSLEDVVAKIEAFSPLDSMRKKAARLLTELVATENEIASTINPTK